MSFFRVNILIAIGLSCKSENCHGGEMPAVVGVTAIDVIAGGC